MAAMIMALSAGAENPIVKITLHEVAIVRRQSLTLGDIATVKVNGQESDLQKNLERGLIVSSARMGTIQFLTRQDIFRWLAETYPQLLPALQVVGAPYTKVDFAGESLSADAFVEVAEECLRSWLARNYDNFSIHSSTSMRNIEVPEGKLVVSAQHCEFTLDSRMTVMVEIRVNKRLYQTIPVDFFVSVAAPVWVATEAQDRHSFIDLNLFQKQLKDMAAAGDDAVTVPEHVKGMRLRRTIQPGQILTKALLEPMPEVTRGGAVTVLAKVGGITISQAAIAMEDGSIHDSVEVENRGNASRYFAKVIGKNTLLAQ